MRVMTVTLKGPPPKEFAPVEIALRGKTEGGTPEVAKRMLDYAVSFFSTQGCVWYNPNDRHRLVAKKTTGPLPGMDLIVIPESKGRDGRFNATMDRKFIVGWLRFKKVTDKIGAMVLSLHDDFVGRTLDTLFEQLHRELSQPESDFWKTPPNQKRDERIHDLWRQGKRDSAIAIEVSLSVPRVKQIRAQNGWIDAKRKRQKKD